MLNTNKLILGAAITGLLMGAPMLGGQPAYAGDSDGSKNGEKGGCEKGSCEAKEGEKAGCEGKDEDGKGGCGKGACEAKSDDDSKDDADSKTADTDGEKAGCEGKDEDGKGGCGKGACA